jgi:hypothetical protein
MVLHGQSNEFTQLLILVFHSSSSSIVQFLLLKILDNVADALNLFIMSNKAHFHLSKYIMKQNFHTGLKSTLCTCLNWNSSMPWHIKFYPKNSACIMYCISKSNDSKTHNFAGQFAWWLKLHKLTSGLVHIQLYLLYFPFYSNAF